ncbi:hypothetical protein QTO34_011998 [Cnephaeus nilssonii]|uniref:Protein adenylyltransferase FICD n=1 Tax=Cnephaeus nilssonii TaxID=3371016 RepID=A0AA40LD73_CNENI|nr:hypothetical protein QTO34_011998 [Eptesicus nilssonii]
MPMASVMAVAEPKWVPIWGRLLWVMLLSMALGSLLALLLPLGAVEEQCLALLKGFSLLRGKWDRAQHAVSRCTSPSTELSVTAKDAALLVVKAASSPAARLEAKAALHQALEMKRQGKRKKAHKLFLHALSMDPDSVDALTEFGIFSEEEKDIIQADYLYTRALTISPYHEKALINRDRTLPLVEEIDQRYFSIIDDKVRKVMSIPKGNSALQRIMEETYYHHIYHTVAIEGNTLTLSEIRHILETRYAVPGKSLEEQNEVIGMHAAMKYINTTLVSRMGSVTISDILEIHRRVLGYVDPVEAGRFRTTQVLVGHHIPPHPQDVEKQMQEFIQWLNSEDAMNLHPVEFAALAHYKTRKSHTFAVFQVRTARLVTSLMQVSADYENIPMQKVERDEGSHMLAYLAVGAYRPQIGTICQCSRCTLRETLFPVSELPTLLPQSHFRTPERTLSRPPF